MSSVRKTDIPRDTRWCRVHGWSEHAGYLTGPASNLSYYCMKCKNVTSQKYHKDVKDGKRTPKKKKQDRQYTPCTGCGELMPLSGDCDIC